MISIRLTAAAMAIALSAGLAVGASGEEFEPGATCEYRELGAPGPSGNRLVMNISSTEIEAIGIRQVGARIEVGVVDSYELEDDDGSGVRIEQIECGGTVPTVTNIDRLTVKALPDPGLSVLIDGSRAAEGRVMSPGATKEKTPGSEIEIAISGQRRAIRTRSILSVIGTPSSDRIDVGSIRERVAVNFNADEDGREPDQDLLPGMQYGEVQVLAGDGDDRISGATGRGGLVLDPWTRMLILGEGGDDRLVGHGGTDRIHGGPGSDLLRGLAGDDVKGWGDFGLTGGKGRDRVYGGSGRDTLGGYDWGEDEGRDRFFGGPGYDAFFVYDHTRDVIDCGTGSIWRLDHDPGLDVKRNCARRAR